MFFRAGLEHWPDLCIDGAAKKHWDVDSMEENLTSDSLEEGEGKTRLGDEARSDDDSATCLHGEAEEAGDTSVAGMIDPYLLPCASGSPSMILCWTSLRVKEKTLKLLAQILQEVANLTNSHRDEYDLLALHQLS